MTKRIAIVCLIIIYISHTLAFADTGFLWTVGHAVVFLTKDEYVEVNIEDKTEEKVENKNEAQEPEGDSHSMDMDEPILRFSEEILIGKLESGEKEETPMPSEAPIVEETVPPSLRTEINEMENVEPEPGSLLKEKL